MFADKIRKLLSFRIEKDSVSQLQLEVNEMICLWKLNRLDEALASFEMAIKLNPINEKALNNRKDLLKN